MFTEISMGFRFPINGKYLMKQQFPWDTRLAVECKKCPHSD